MDIVGHAKRVRIYVNEGDHFRHQPVHLAIIELLHREHASGATVMRAIEGFGGPGPIRTSRLVDVESKLPVVIEWIDTPESVELLLPHIKEMVTRGLITVDDTDVTLYYPTPIHDISAKISAAEVMTRDVATVAHETPVREVVELMLGKIYRAVPVVDAALHPLGIITNADLVARGGLAVRMELLPSLETPELHRVLELLASNHKTAGEIMTPQPVSVAASTPLTEVAEIMAGRWLKRLPVVAEDGALVGIISRLDLLRTVVAGVEREEAEPLLIGLSGDTPVAAVMRRDVPAVHPETPIGEALQAVVSTRLNRTIVVDAGRHVVGIITDAELLDRVTPALRPGALRSLMHRLPFVHPSSAELATEHHATGKTAGDLMTTDVATVLQETPLREAIALMLPQARKVVVVVDHERRLVGIVDRADILHGLIATG